MGIQRVTPGMMVTRTLHNLSQQSKSLLTLQEQLATGKAVNSPSDDPIAARRSINTRTLIAKSEQYMANITAVGPQLTESESAIQTSIDNLARARELTLRGANTTLAQSQLDDISEEINQILEGMFASANHVTNDRYIFAGTRTNAAPFEATRNADGEITSVTYVGNTESITTTIGDGRDIEVNEDGESAFLSNQDIFQTLIDIRDNLRSGNTAALGEDSITELDSVKEQFLSAMARIGAIQNRLENTQTQLEDYQYELQVVLSDTENADYSEVMVNLNAQSNAYQAALNAAAQVIQPSLLDYL